MLPQEALIARVRRVCAEDRRLTAALMYGSFAAGEGDAFSDIEVLLYFDDALLPAVDQDAWLRQIAPVALSFVNEFGIRVAIFDESLIRGEFHFDRAADIARIDAGWREYDWLPSYETALVLDRTGALTDRLRSVVGPPLVRRTPERIASVAHNVVNWLLFGVTVLARGEHARAHEILGHVGRHLLWLARLAEGVDAHWPTPSRALETDLPAGAYARYAACTAPLDPAALAAAYRAA